MTESYHMGNIGQDEVTNYAPDVALPPWQHRGMAGNRPRNYLRAWRLHRNLRQEMVAARVNTTKATISRLENDKRTVNVEWLDRLARIYDTTREALLLPPKSEHDDPDGRPVARMVPLIDSVQAGRWTEVVDPYPKGAGSEYIPIYRQIGPNAFALRIEGDSMLPEFRSGEIIIVDPDVAPAPGRYVVAKLDHDDQASFKRYRLRSGDKPSKQAIELVPLNSDWPTLTIDKSNPGRIVGVAVDHYRKLV